MNTLAVSDRSIRTVVKSTSWTSKALSSKTWEENTVISQNLIYLWKRESGPTLIQSHESRAITCLSQTKREYIGGGLTVAALHRDYVKKCVSENKPYVTYQNYFNIFKNEFNISFWQPKEDQCEDCTSFNNSEDKTALQNNRKEHLLQKSLSRAEKDKDKENASNNFKVAVYNSQAVMPCPRGDVSCFYYISKINLLNFTNTELGSKNTTCFVWHEGEGARGVN